MNDEYSRDMLFSFYLLAISAIAFFCCAFLHFFLLGETRAEARSYLAGTGAGTHAQKESFDHKIKEQVEKEVAIYIVTGVLCLLGTIMILITAVNSFYFSKKPFMYHHANQLLHMVQVLIACIAICCAYVLSKYDEYYKVEEIYREWPIHTIVSLAGFSIAFSLLSWFLIVTEKFELMRIVTSLNLLIMMAIGVISFFVISDSTQYQEKFDCYSAMQAISRNDFSDFHCANKYLGATDNYEKLIKE